ncbi:MAG TPA: hypothetical protein VG326_20470 [Tepidisphaeraceae bacterium]|jgi:hypothetical protein|nr:hypothetical protein [Tepidisphaeraceae bacterium]
MPENNITDTRPQFLSPLAVKILDSRPDAYQSLVVAGTTSESARALLAGVKPQQLLTLPVVNPQDAGAMLGGLWLWHDSLDACHKIVQDLIGPTGAFWHAIMHRREGDFSNAKYWYARCADHRVFRLISAMGIDLIGRDTTDESLLRIVGAEYNPDALVDLIEAIHEKAADPRRQAVIRIQQLEWEALFNHCAYEATASPGGMI